LLNSPQPRQFIAFNMFDLHKMDVYRGVRTRVLSQAMTHLDYYRQKFAGRGDQVVIEVGESHVTVAKYPGKNFDLIYIDADHSYQTPLNKMLMWRKAKRTDNVSSFSTITLSSIL
jgi:hypothetical protein